jgi:hypothetical protein
MGVDSASGCSRWVAELKAIGMGILLGSPVSGYDRRARREPGVGGTP